MTTHTSDRSETNSRRRGFLILGLLVSFPTFASAQESRIHLDIRPNENPTLASPYTGNALSVSGLKDQDLSPVAAPFGALASLVEKNQPPLELDQTAAKFSSVSVLEDRARELTIRIRFEEMPETAKSLVVQALDHAMKPLRGVSPVSARLAGQREGLVTMVLKFQSGDFLGRNSRQRRLVVLAVGEKASVVLGYQIFECDKTWYYHRKSLSAKALAPLPKEAAPALASGQGSPLVLRQLNASDVSRLSAPSSAASSQLKTLAIVSAVQKPLQKVVSPPPPKPIVPPTKPIRRLGKIRVPPAAPAKTPAPAPEPAPPPPPIDRTPKGPVIQQGFSFGDRIAPSLGLADPSGELSILHELYADQNPESGYYYYLPARYVLDYEPGTGFGLQIYYDSEAGGSSNNVVVRATLRAAVQPEDLRIAESFLKQDCAKNGRPFQHLDPFRFANARVNLDAMAATTLEIATDKVHAQIFSEGGIVSIEFVTTTRQLDRFITLATRNGLYGTIEYSSSADANIKRQIPLEIRLPNRISLSSTVKLSVDKTGPAVRGELFNTSRFPIALRYLHVLRYSSATPEVHSFVFPLNEIGAGGKVAVDSVIPPSLLSGLARIWADYEVVADQASVNTALKVATASAAQSGSAAFVVRRVGEIDPNISAIRVTLVSRYLDPAGLKEVICTGSISPTDDSIKLGTAFLRDRQEGIDYGGTDYLCSYTIDVDYKDARKSQRIERQNTNYLTISIGQAQLEGAR
jgi:hypothetical protein